jgi:hypothetical protein
VESPTISECGGLRFPHRHRPVPGKKVTRGSGGRIYQKSHSDQSISVHFFVHLQVVLELGDWYLVDNPRLRYRLGDLFPPINSGYFSFANDLCVV